MSSIDKNTLAGSILSQISAGTDIPVKLAFPEDDLPSAIAVVKLESVSYVNTGDPGTFRADVCVTGCTLSADDPDGSILAGMAVAVSDSVTSLNLTNLSPAAVGRVGNDTSFDETEQMRKFDTRFQLFFSL